MMKLPEGIDPNHVPLKLAGQLLNRSDLDKLARRLPIHTEGPPGKGVRRFTTWAAIQKFHQPHPGSFIPPRKARVSEAVRRMRKVLA